MSNSYETLCEIYDRGQGRIDSSLPSEISYSRKAALRPLVRTLSENVATYVLNYSSQVLNGGHQQWVDNSYLKEDHGEFKAILALIGGEHCLKVLKMVDEVIEHTGSELEMPYVEEGEDDFDPLGHLDTQFYKFDKEFHDEVLTWIEDTERKVAVEQEIVEIGKTS